MMTKFQNNYVEALKNPSKDYSEFVGAVLDLTTPYILKRMAGYPDADDAIFSVVESILKNKEYLFSRADQPPENCLKLFYRVAYTAFCKYVNATKKIQEHEVKLTDTGWGYMEDSAPTLYECYLASEQVMSCLDGLKRIKNPDQVLCFLALTIQLHTPRALAQMLRASNDHRQLLNHALSETVTAFDLENDFFTSATFQDVHFRWNHIHDDRLAHEVSQKSAECIRKLRNMPKISSYIDAPAKKK